ncbi:hypothetical protein [Spongiactinospora sp. TRM90649]|uniref:hypothetical protein n=1 Tax=Spongiactinospora sp. TRM90649 TaxID=3031114 RepID=UPI0023F89952|nr:hypothetical protein [Spongiactinospora sp. TRM90649]MDF5753109.1 hypothetical protein [Spongiactinospora sp. TRM90649]
MDRDDEETLRARAQAGDAEAMVDLWLALRHGATAGEGEVFVRRAVEAGSIRGARMLAAWLGRTDPAERERLLLLAAGAGDRTSAATLADLYYEAERWPEAEEWLRRAADLGAGWPVGERLALLLARRGADDEVWELCLRADDDPGGDFHGLAAAVGFYSLSEALAEEGNERDAARWMKEAYDFGLGGAIVRFGEERERAGDLVAAERLFREAGADHALAGFLERRGRVAEARELHEAGGDSDRLADFLERNGDPAEAAAIRERLRREREVPAAEADWVTTVATVVTTVALIPFVEGLVGRLAEGAYDGVRHRLRELARKLARGHETAESTLIVVHDPHSHLRLHMRTDATDEALSALRTADLEGPGGAVRWNPEIREWERR